MHELAMPETDRAGRAGDFRYIRRCRFRNWRHSPGFDVLAGENADRIGESQSRVPILSCFAGPVVVGDRLALFHRRGGEEVLEGINVANGATVWTHAYRTTYRDDFGFDEGPRSVPVVDDGVVYTFGAQGQLHAVDLTTGAARWSVDTHDRYQVRKGFFGAAGSPLVSD